MIPNEKNFCGGAYRDWLEVYLTGACNGNCSWCVDKQGFKPKYQASVHDMVLAILDTGTKNVILLGGEPTLYHDIKYIIDIVNAHGVKVYLTTNGSRLTPGFVVSELRNLTGINISIHSYSLMENYRQTRVEINYEDLGKSVEELHRKGVKVRFNCNCIKGFIDSRERILEYIKFAKWAGADSVRFAELKNDRDEFVNLSELLDINIDNPFTQGCNHNIVISDMPVNIRLMCGFQTPNRPKPKNPPTVENKQILYYNGQIYNGWQEKGDKMEDQIKEILNKVATGELTQVEGLALIKELGVLDEEIPVPSSSGYCAY